MENIEAFILGGLIVLYLLFCRWFVNAVEQELDDRLFPQRSPSTRYPMAKSFFKQHPNHGTPQQTLEFPSITAIDIPPTDSSLTRDLEVKRAPQPSHAGTQTKVESTTSNADTQTELDSSEILDLETRFVETKARLKDCEAGGAAGRRKALDLKQRLEISERLRRDLAAKHDQQQERVRFLEIELCNQVPVVPVKSTSEYQDAATQTDKTDQTDKLASGALQSEADVAMDVRKFEESYLKSNESLNKSREEARRARERASEKQRARRKAEKRLTELERELERARRLVNADASAAETVREAERTTNEALTERDATVCKNSELRTVVEQANAERNTALQQLEAALNARQELVAARDAAIGQNSQLVTELQTAVSAQTEVAGQVEEQLRRSKSEASEREKTLQSKIDQYWADGVKLVDQQKLLTDELNSTRNELQTKLQSAQNLAEDYRSRFEQAYSELQLKLQKAQADLEGARIEASSLRILCEQLQQQVVALQASQHPEGNRSLTQDMEIAPLQYERVLEQSEARVEISYGEAAMNFGASGNLDASMNLGTSTPAVAATTTTTTTIPTSQPQQKRQSQAIRTQPPKNCPKCQKPMMNGKCARTHCGARLSMPPRQEPAPQEAEDSLEKNLLQTLREQDEQEAVTAAQARSGFVGGPQRKTLGVKGLRRKYRDVPQLVPQNICQTHKREMVQEGNNMPVCPDCEEHNKKMEEVHTMNAELLAREGNGDEDPDLDEPAQFAPISEEVYAVWPAEVEESSEEAPIPEEEIAVWSPEEPSEDEWENGMP